MQLEGAVIGLIEDDPVMGGSLVQSLTLEGCRVHWWKTAAEAASGVRVSSPDLVISDIQLPDQDGQTLFRKLAEGAALPPFLFITAYGDIDQAVALMKEGAADYLAKPFAMAVLIERAKSLMERSATARPAGALGVSMAMQEVESILRRVCDLTTPLLFSGETGVGKEVCARFLHGISLRSREPFVAVNCAAIPADAMERELFGHRGVAGHALHRGLAERARGGILFLDEIAELPLALQAKLLRLVETREYHRVGGEQSMVFHGRIVCATNRDLQELVHAGRFREDFYYRIAGMAVDVPPLRQRREDIASLIQHFFDDFKGNRGARLKGVSPLTFETAADYPWPGNAREVRNRVERAIALAKSEWVMPRDLFPDLAEVLPTFHEAILGSKFPTLSEARDRAEKRQIERALRETDGHHIAAAKLLGISRTTLWEKMRRLDIAD